MFSGIRTSLKAAYRRAMAAMNYPASGPQNADGPHTVTAMSRWSCISKSLPAPERIKSLHVYDFDNTLFKTPLPNSALWNHNTINLLCRPDYFINGGWWHDSRFLAATGEGIEKEEARGFPGWWNERVVELVQLSNKQQDVLCVLLTGRGEKNFSEVIKRICKSRDLEFDLMGLKPAVAPTNQRFNTTMAFKQLFLQNLMETYRHAEEIRIYEDRFHHVQQFREFLAQYNHKRSGVNGMPATRPPLTAEVIPVTEISNPLNPVVEVAEVLKMINDHNHALTKGEHQFRRAERLALKKTVFFTSYMIEPADSKKLVNLVDIPDDVKLRADNILISPQHCPAQILEKVGGMGSKMKWRVTDTGCYETSLWAARLQPVPDTANYHSGNKCPLVILALRRSAQYGDANRITNWQPVPADKAFVFETTVREKMALRVEAEDVREGESQNRTFKRKHMADDAFARAPKEPSFGRNERGHLTSQHHRGGYNQGRGNNHRGNNRGFRGGRGSGGGGRGRGGRGGGFSYKSLDDMSRQQGADGGVDYDDHHPPPAQHSAPHNPPSFMQKPPPLQQYGGLSWQSQQPLPPGPQGRPPNASGGGGGADIGSFY